MQILFLLGRILFGGFFVFSGYGHFKNASAMAGYAASKGVPMAKAAIIFSGMLIFLGGLGVVLGIFVPYSLGLLILFLVPVTFTMHRYWNETDPGLKAANRVNFWKNLALLGAVLMMYSLTGPWPYSLKW